MQQPLFKILPQEEILQMQLQIPHQRLTPQLLSKTLPQSLTLQSLTLPHKLMQLNLLRIQVPKLMEHRVQIILPTHKIPHQAVEMEHKEQIQLRQ